MSIIGLGTDLVDIKKLEKKLSGRYGSRFLENTFTQNEISCSCGGKNVAKLATAFAAKEAVYKAFRTGWIEGKDVELIREENGAPSILLHGEIEKIAKKKKTNEVHASLSFTDSHAVAVVLVIS
ncbi:MAG: holo-ACP synthase [Candidatus Micrarchaeia archaeon]